MTTRYFCDHCGQEIVGINDDVNLRSLWAGHGVHVVLQMMLCLQCTAKLEKMVQEFVPTVEPFRKLVTIIG